MSDSRKLIAEIVIRCPIPSKKNQLRPTGHNERRARRTPLVYKKGVAEKLLEIQQHIMIAWKGRGYVIHPEIEVDWFYTDATQDRDGIWTTALDCLKKTGVIFDDSIKWFNGKIIQFPAQRAEHPRDVRMVIRIYDLQS